MRKYYVILISVLLVISLSAFVSANRVEMEIEYGDLRIHKITDTSIFVQMDREFSMYRSFYAMKFLPIVCYTFDWVEPSEPEYYSRSSQVEFSAYRNKMDRPPVKIVSYPQRENRR